MKYIVVTEKSVDQAVVDLQVAVADHSFGVLHVHNLKATLNSKGVPFEAECQILEVCNPHKAKEVLTADMSMNMALPCRISVWEESGETRIGMIRPEAMLASLSDSDQLRAIAEEVERIAIDIIDQAR